MDLREAGAVRSQVNDHRRVVRCDPQSDRRWDTFVAGHPDALPYHHRAWLQVLHRTYGYRCSTLACEDPDGRLLGVLPLLERRGILTGRVLSSLPHTPVAGPLCDGASTSALLVQRAARLAEEKRAWLQLKVASPDLDEVGAVSAAPWESTYVLPLPEKADELRFGNSRNHARIKWAVNKAAKAGVQVRDAEDKTDLRAWYELYLDTMRWHVVPPRPFRFFENIWDIMGQGRHMRLLLAQQRGRGRPLLLAGSLFLTLGASTIYAFNGRRSEYLRLRPNDAIHWRAIHDACERGARRYDFGEVSEENLGLAEFKSKWGAEARRLYRYHYPASRELESRAFRPGSPARKLATAAWRRLPRRATSLLGEWVYSRL